MTETLFNQNSYLQVCRSRITSVSERGIELDRTVFYAQGGGQPGDNGKLIKDDGNEIKIVNTIKGDNTGVILHQAVDSNFTLNVNETVSGEINWARRYRFMRMHTCLHLLSAVIAYPVTGGKISEGKGSLDFNITDVKLDKDHIDKKLSEIIARNDSVQQQWISDSELESKPELVKTMSVKPPVGSGSVRLIKIGNNVDLQPCGGTHVKKVGEIGAVEVKKIENKGRQNRRVIVQLVEAIQ